MEKRMKYLERQKLKMQYKSRVHCIEHPMEVKNKNKEKEIRALIFGYEATRVSMDQGTCISPVQFEKINLHETNFEYSAIKPIQPTTTQSIGVGSVQATRDAFTEHIGTDSNSQVSKPPSKHFIDQYCSPIAFSEKKPQPLQGQTLNQSFEQ
jgi:hypothetical protein